MPKEIIITLDLPGPMEAHFHPKECGDSCPAMAHALRYSHGADGWQFERDGAVVESGGLLPPPGRLFRFIFKEH